MRIHSKSKEHILKLENQDNHVWRSEVDKYHVSIVKIQEQLKGLYPGTNNDVLLVPDTKALYANHDLESWNYSEFDCFRPILTPSVLAGLDKHKIEHWISEVRQKAIKLIKRIKENRRRGSLLDGVPIINDSIYIKMVATEPDFCRTLGWFE